MLLLSAQVGPFKSINEPRTVNIEKSVTVLVGMNEAGKTVFLQGLQKANDVLKLAKYNPISDYPRKDLVGYLKTHKSDPSEVAVLTYAPTLQEIAGTNAALHTNLQADFTFTITHRYDNSRSIGIAVDEAPVLGHYASKEKLSPEAAAAVKKAASVRDIPKLFAAIGLTDDDKAFLAGIEKRIAATDEVKWPDVIQHEVWRRVEPLIPKFLYFDNYSLLPAKMNLTDLAQRVERSKTESGALETHHRSVLALLRMADISIQEFADPGGYEQLKAKIEAVSISLTQQIMEFWRQNDALEVEIDIKQDPNDTPPYNSGANLYLRIKNQRHKGVSTPFDQRSHGFIWFFSFLVWFNEVQYQIAGTGTMSPGRVILLLDEPGLALHALAQADFLRYIDNLSEKHQVLYTTHSPFMVHSDRLQQVRLVEDRDKIGTIITDMGASIDPRTIFPLQAALGWTIAQNLFISKKNLLVEGSSELVYLQSLSASLESAGRVGIQSDITIVPVGGLDKVATFIALLNANKLKMAVLHDFRGVPEQRLDDLVKQKLISAKAILNVSQFRDLSNIGKNGVASDIEDLFEVDLYVELFNNAYKRPLNGSKVISANLPSGDRITERIERYLDSKGMKVRPSGGFNHYVVASYFASNPPALIGADTLLKFEELFKSVNSLL